MKCVYRNNYYFLSFKVPFALTFFVPRCFSGSGGQLIGYSIQGSVTLLIDRLESSGWREKVDSTSTEMSLTHLIDISSQLMQVCEVFSLMIDIELN